MIVFDVLHVLHSYIFVCIHWDPWKTSDCNKTVNTTNLSNIQGGIELAYDYFWKMLRNAPWKCYDYTKETTQVNSENILLNLFH